jgi:hypothetical protein
VIAHYFEGDDYELVAPSLMSRQASRRSKDTPAPDVPEGVEEDDG